MNFIDAKMTEKDEKYFVQFLGYTVEVPQERGGKETFAQYVGKAITLGRRPEDFHREERYLETCEAPLHVKVDIVELMGAEVYVYGDCAGQRVLVRTPARYAAKSDEMIQVVVDVNKMHLFDKETQRAIGK